MTIDAPTIRLLADLLHLRAARKPFILRHFRFMVKFMYRCADKVSKIGTIELKDITWI